MRHIPADPPAFFHRGPSPLTRVTFLGLVSIVLLFADTRYRYLEQIRYGAEVVLYPLQRAVQWPSAAAHAVGAYFASQRALTDENGALKRQLTEQALGVQGFTEAARENAQLRRLLEVRERYHGVATAVEVLYTGRDPFSQKLFVDKGSDAGLVPGEAVIDATGVVGQITRVYPAMAEVTLVTDKDQAVPVKVERSGVRSVLFGTGAGRLPELRFMAPSADTREGDVLVTSGIDGTYPPGLRVAQVASIERDTGQIFARVAATPLAGVDHNHFLLVLKPTAAIAPRPEVPEASATDAPGRSKLRRRR